MFVRLIRRSLLRSPRRKLMTVSAVALASSIASAMFAVLFGIGDRVGRELRSFGANLSVRPKAASLAVDIGGVDYRPAGGETYIPESALPRLKATFWRNNITAFAPFLSTGVDAAGARTTLVGTWFRRNYLTPGRERLSTGIRDLNPAWEVEGEWSDDPTRDPSRREVLLGSVLARRLGLAAGDRVELLGQSFLVRGLLVTGGLEETQIFTRLETVQTLTSRPGQVERIQVSALTKPEDAFASKDRSRMTPDEYDRWYCSPYISSIAHQIQEQIPSAVARPIRQVAENEGRILSQVQLLMLLISLAAMGTAVLLIWSATVTTVLERRSEIALMKAVGAQDAWIASLLAVEAGLQGAGGGTLGAAGGLAMADLISRRVFALPLEVSPTLAPLVILTAVVVCLAGSAVPLRAALRLPAAAVLRE